MTPDITSVEVLIFGKPFVLQVNWDSKNVYFWIDKKIVLEWNGEGNAFQELGED